MLSLSPALLLGACGVNAFPVLSTDGPVASTERDLLFSAVGLMLIVVIPVFVMTGWFAWHYRASNVTARYMPHWSSSSLVEAFIWLIPIAIITGLGAIVWIYSYRLDPYRALAANKSPLHVETISLDWKWLFIYPQQHIATVNRLVIPSDRPINMKLTSDTVMDAFYVPGLVGQIYTMAGMQTQLHTLADKPACFSGLNTMYSGRGFSDQHFPVEAIPAASFRAWIKDVKRSPLVLNAATYSRLHRPSTNVPATYYSAVEPNLFYKVIAKYNKVIAGKVRGGSPGKKPSGENREQPRVS